MKLELIQNVNELVELLKNEKLPADDIELNNTNKIFHGVYESGKLNVCIGLEVYLSLGLLRSFVVKGKFKNQGVGSEVLKQFEELAKKTGITNIYLLTSTAEVFFAKQGYKVIERKFAPEVIQKTKQFSELCPSSAKLMHKVI